MSRRHGKSLGINVGLKDQKVCTWGCVYCQCGMGQRRDIQPGERKESAAQVLALAEAAIERNTDLDSVTFAGNSEPTSHPEFSLIVDGLIKIKKSKNAHWVLNCLSNGSELDRDSVVEACDKLDETWIKLDCGNQNLFERLNRPLERLGTVDQQIGRIKKLKKIYIQTLVWCSPDKPALSNWTLDNRASLIHWYLTLRPEKIHLTTVARSPAVPQLKPVPIEEMRLFANNIRRDGISIEVY